MIKKVMVLTLFFSTSLLLGHGIELSMGKKYPCVFIKAEYSGSSAAAHVDVKVFFQEEKEEFQKGFTDKNGVFSFCPDQTGQWTVIVDDLMGHRKSMDITIHNDFFNPQSKEIKNKTPGKKEKKIKFTTNDMCCYLLKIGLGVILILVITFILHRWKKRHET